MPFIYKMEANMRIFGLESNFQTSFEVMRAHLSLDRFDVDMTFEKADGLCGGFDNL